MPQLCSESAAQPSSSSVRHAEVERRRRRKTLAAGGKPPRSPWDGPPLSILALPSPTIGSTCTTHNEMLFWVGWFARFHVEAPRYVPYQLKTLDCPVVRKDGSAVLHGDGQPQLMRCVREVARCEVGGEVKWQMISWNVGQAGVTFHECANYEDAMRAFLAPLVPVREP